MEMDLRLRQFNEKKLQDVYLHLTREGAGRVTHIQMVGCRTERRKYQLLCLDFLVPQLVFVDTTMWVIIIDTMSVYNVEVTAERGTTHVDAPKKGPLRGYYIQHSCEVSDQTDQTSSRYSPLLVANYIGISKESKTRFA